MADLATFTAQAQALRDQMLAEGLDVLRKVVVETYARLLDESAPFARTGRYRANHRVAIGAPDETSTTDTSPNEGLGRDVAERVKFGDTIYFSNNVGFGEQGKSRSYAFFVEYGHGHGRGEQKQHGAAPQGGLDVRVSPLQLSIDGRFTEPRLVYEKTQLATETLLEGLVADFNNRRIG